jgi:hypothetical protein
MAGEFAASFVAMSSFGYGRQRVNPCMRPECPANGTD